MNIELVSYEDLIGELKKRFDTFIFHGIQRKTQDIDTYKLDYHGGKATCIGLTEVLKKTVLNEIIEDFDDADLQDKGEE